jgi:peroxiredoxin
MTQAIIGQDAPKAGDKAPSWQFVNYQGDSITLTESLNKATVIVFWHPACAPCRAELPQLETLYTNYKNDGLTIVALDVTSSREEGIKFATSNELTFDFLLADMDVASAYGVSATPTLFLVDRQGRIVEEYRGHHYGLEEKIISLLELEPTNVD